MTSSLAHCAYSFVSLVVILSMFDPVEHAMLNTSKRLTLVVAFYLLISANYWNYFNIACALTSLSLNIYGSNFKYKDQQGKLITNSIVTILLLGAIFCFGLASVVGAHGPHIVHFGIDMDHLVAKLFLLKDNAGKYFT